MKYLSIIIGLVFLTQTANAQNGRDLARTGNSQYKAESYVDAEVSYKKSLEQDPELIESAFNLGDALFQQERFEEAASQFERSANNTDDVKLKAKSYYNLGNALLKGQKLDESIEAYKNSLRNDPTDLNAKYNLAYAKRLKQKQEQEQQDQDQNKDEDKDEDKEGEENKEKEKNEDGEKEEDKEGEKSEDEQKGEGEEENKEEQEQKDSKEGDADKDGEEKEGAEQKPGEEGEQKDQMSMEDAKRILEALKNEELKVQEKLAKEKGKGQKIKVEKDW